MLLSSSRLLSRVTPSPVRTISTQVGLGRILEKNPDDVVITFAKRTAVGKAKKGQFRDTPIDELLHGLFKVWEGAVST
jgi:acetyl-CoA acyltransferase 1